MNNDFDEYDELLDLKENDAKNINDAIGTVITKIEPLTITEFDANIVGYIITTKRQNIRLGLYAVIPCDNEHLFTRIQKLAYIQEFEVDDANEIHSNRMLKSNIIDEQDYKFLSFFDPICILYEDNAKNLIRRMCDRIPRPNSPIFPVTDKLKIQTGLNIPTKGIFIGHLSVGGEIVKTSNSEGATVPYHLNNDYSLGDPLIFRHVLVCGSTGTGKSFLTKNILRQFMSKDNRYKMKNMVQSDGSKVTKQPCIVIMDPQDEYSKMHENNPELTREYREQLSAFDIEYDGCDVKTFSAKVDWSSYSPTSKTPHMEYSIPFKMVQNNPWLIMSSEFNENQYLALDLLIKDYFKDDANPTYNGFIEFIDDGARKIDYVDSGKIHDATFGSVLRRVINSAYKTVFDTSAKPIDEIVKDVFKPGLVSVFPTEYISNSRSRDLIILSLMSMIVDSKLSTTGDEHIKNTPIILVLDEAHRYLSKSMNEHSRRIISKFADAARQGRKEGLGLFLITQDPQDIDDTVFKQINTRVIMKLSNDAAINAMKVKKEFEKRIPYLKKGQMIIHSPDNSDLVELVGLSKCVVLDR
ncbi:MAG: ATP-binding protein [Methanosarcinaceae archaeon]|nr:ATP-binding protein [Methanosarcinaceae archaeon]